MALRTLVLGRKINERKKDLENLYAEKRNIEQEAHEVEDALNELDENSTEEEKNVVDEKATELDKKQSKNETEILSAEEEIRSWENEIAELRTKIESAAKTPNKPNERKDIKVMQTRKFFNLNSEERDAFFRIDEVRTFLTKFREKGLEASSEKRSINGAELGIPTAFLDIIRENIMSYSKLINRVRLRTVNGKARQTIMGTIPEAVWTEMCAAINEINFNINDVEVDGYKVGALIFICRSLLEDSTDIDLAYEIVEGLLIALGSAIDKAILYGLGTKMPLGIAVRLAQTSAPSDYPQQARPWENLSTHLVTIPTSATGIEFFKEIVKAGGLIKGKYSRGIKFWAMNESTYTKIKVEGMNANAAGQIVSITEGVMPVAGGDIIILSDDIIPNDNIIAGYGDLYLLAEREGSNIARSDEYRFGEDQVAFKGTARYDGIPVIPEAFIAIGIGSAPVTSATFAGDKANDATLAEVLIGNGTLVPTFKSSTYAYTATVTTAEEIITAVPNQVSAKIDMQFDEKRITNNQKVKVAAGKHNLVITVKNGLSKLTYTVEITKGA